jgi:hypothetical protein
MARSKNLSDDVQRLFNDYEVLVDEAGTKTGTKGKLQGLVDAYAFLLKNVDALAHKYHGRAYGGIVRAGKGLLVESLTKGLVKIAWQDAGFAQDRLETERHVIRVPLKEDYLVRIKSPEVKEYIRKNIKRFYYPLKTDIHAHVDGDFKLAIECKAYTENAMLKRILVDFTLLKQVYPNLSFALVQLESQLGGDYGTPNPVKYGSTSTHTLFSYFDIDLNILTLLEGERQVNKPIHRAAYYKSLGAESLLTALDVIQQLLKKNA